MVELRGDLKGQPDPQLLREQSREEYILLAREQLERELKKNGYEPSVYLKPEILQEVAGSSVLSKGTTFCSPLATVNSSRAVAAKLVAVKEPEKKQLPVVPGEKPDKPAGRASGVKVKGVPNLLVRYSRCCNPVPGDEIIGFTTRGKGVAVHRVDCPTLPKEPERFIQVEWDAEETGVYPLAIKIEAQDRNNLLVDIMNVMSLMKINVSAVNVRTDKGLASLDFTVEVHHLDEAKELVSKLRTVKSVQKVFRTTRGKRNRKKVERKYACATATGQFRPGFDRERGYRGDCPGLLVLLGVSRADQEADLQLLVEKIINLRIFEDEQGKMNRSVQEVGGAILMVSQFTLYADCRKGRRPSFLEAAPPEMGADLYERFIAALRAKGMTVATGRFGATMAVELVNDGPVTIMLDTADWRKQG